jgi:hypothetical protein
MWCGKGARRGSDAVGDGQIGLRGVNCFCRLSEAACPADLTWRTRFELPAPGCRVRACPAWMNGGTFLDVHETAFE